MNTHKVHPSYPTDKQSLPLQLRAELLRNIRALRRAATRPRQRPGRLSTGDDPEHISSIIDRIMADPGRCGREVRL